MKGFGELLAIKTLREQRAQRELLEQRRALLEAVQARDEAQRKLANFSADARTREQEMYGDLCMRVVQVRDIQDVQGEVDVLHAGIKRHRTEADAAETHRREQERELGARRDSHAFAQRTRDKYVELDGIFAVDARAEVEALEEAVIEEAADLRWSSTEASRADA